MNGLTRGVSIAGCLLALGVTIFHVTGLNEASGQPGFWMAEARLPSPDAGGAFYREQLIDAAGQASVHSATLANLPDGDVGIWWFGGSREGGKDVRLWFARRDRQTGAISDPRSVMSREQLSSQLGRYIKKLGNPAAVLDRDGRLWLFFVSVSIGGWAGSAVNYMVSEDGGASWTSVRRLVTSPFFNVSTLVRISPVLLQNGDLAVPVYHEFIGKFGEILVLGHDGTVRGKHRLTWGDHALQPALIPVSGDQAVVLMRNSENPPGRMLVSTTTDGGVTFGSATESTLPNADNSVTGGSLPDGSGTWIVYNSSETGREVLSIAVADRSGGNAVRVHDLESGERGDAYSYPAIVTDAAGWHHVAWTHNRTNIKHAIFNDTWLMNVAGTGTDLQ